MKAFIKNVHVTQLLTPSTSYERFLEIRHNVLIMHMSGHIRDGKKFKWWREREKLYLKSFLNWEKVPTYCYILLCTSIKQAIKLSYTYIADIKVFHVEKSYFSTFLYTRRNFSVLLSCLLTIQLSCSYLNRFSICNNVWFAHIFNKMTFILPNIHSVTNIMANIT